MRERGPETRWSVVTVRRCCGRGNEWMWEGRHEKATGSMEGEDGNLKLSGTTNRDCHLI